MGFEGKKMPKVARAFGVKKFDGHGHDHGEEHEEDCHVCKGSGKDHGKTCGHCGGSGHEPHEEDHDHH